MDLKLLLDDIKGVVFDFNGTLFLDNDINELTWRQFIQAKFNVPVSDEDFIKYFHGVNNKETLEHYAKRKLTEEEVIELGDDGKEAVYRQFILDHPGRQILTQGATDLFKILKEREIPYTIATASCLKNVEFFFEIFKLDQFFNRSKVIYDNKKLKSKPNPELYLKAFEKIGVNPKEGLVFEDALSGLKAARNAKAKYIIAVDPAGKHNYQDLDYVDFKIKNFSDLINGNDLF